MSRKSHSVGKTGFRSSLIFTSALFLISLIILCLLLYY